MSGGHDLKLDEEQFREDGFFICRGILSTTMLKLFDHDFTNVLSGKRSFCMYGALAQSSIAKLLSEVANKFTGAFAYPVRVIYFDKTEIQNWALGWHQDRTIAVKQRENIEDFDIWSKKEGVTHVEPPFEVMEKSVTLRVSIDDTDESNGALEVITATHNIGRLSVNETQILAGRAQSTLLKTQAGDVVVLATPIVHRSRSSRSRQRRRIVHIDYSWATLPAPLEWAFMS